MEKINLGDEVKDNITGFKGIVVSAHHYLHGCRRLSVQPKLIKGDLKESHTFDEPQLILLKKAKVKKGNTRIGGPDKFMDTGR